MCQIKKKILKKRNICKNDRKHHYQSTKTNKITIHLATTPAQQAQVDYGYIGMLLDPLSKKLRKSYAFIMTLAHSRHRFVYFVFRQDVETWIDCHVRAFNFFGGVPEIVVPDYVTRNIIWLMFPFKLCY